MKIMTIKFQTGINPNHRKESNFQEQLTGLVMIEGELREAVVLRIYGTQARNYACLWYNNKEGFGSGSGSAGGYGYHRPSEAAHQAFIVAGVDVEHFGGRGSSSMESAVMALTKKLYPRRKVWVTRAHG